MIKVSRVLALGVMGAAVLVACGDNSRVCGPGTTDLDGVCTGPSGNMCGDGTRLDPITQTCVPDPSTCGGGTVLINNECQDPSAGLEVDVLEGPEPNGFEPNATPAGVLPPLRPVGGKGLTIHGCIQPLDNDTPDFDNYLLTVTAPTLVKITNDGVQGLAGGFVVLSTAADGPLASFERFGINHATDVSRREVYLPAAGTYILTIADTRTLQGIIDQVIAPPPAGNPDGTSCYYVTIDQRAPTIKHLDLAAGDAGTMGEDLAFYTAPLPLGFTRVSAALATPHAETALQIHNNGALRQLAGSSALFAGIKANDTPLFVLDYTFNSALFPVDYTIAVDFAIDSTPLSTNGSTVTATSKGRSFGAFTDINLFHWDVAFPNNTDGIDITFSKDVQGVIADQDGFIVANMTGFQIPFDGPVTFTHYKGLVREQAPGRYYFFVFVPRDPVGTSFTATSRIAMVNAPTFMASGFGFSSNANAFNALPFGLDTSALSPPWLEVFANGTNTNGVGVRLFDRRLAVGRLDLLAVRTGPGAGSVASCSTSFDCPFTFTCAANACVKATDFAPLADFSGAKAFPDTNLEARGVILRNAFALTPVTPTDLFVVVNTNSGTGHFDVSFDQRVHDNFGGPIAAGTTQTRANETLTSFQPERRYFADTAPGNFVTITATPTTPGMDVAIKLLANDESTRATIDVAGANGVESLRFVQDASGFTAFKVDANLLGTYRLEVKVEPPFYTVATTATAFADACTGGTAQPLLDATGFFDPTDEGLTAPIAAPAGFSFYGAAAASFVVSSNGFLSFHTSTTNAAFFPSVLPDGVGDANIAPAWTDLAGVAVCTKTVGGKLVVQWTGTERASFLPVQFQAILDPGDDSIEFVYGPNHGPAGFSAVAGVQTTTGDEATLIGAFSAFIAPNTSKKLSH
ncbi:MAG: hypothetical protein KF773_10725 [Deltaproteobacteria bacterium]|nr:hypothetical protein [Deltaproteobacteria bacterium]